MRIIYTQPNSFTVNIKGECQFSADEKRQLSTASRIGYWGCWLVFEQESAISKSSTHQSYLQKLLAQLNLPRYFISSRSLSAKQFARLSRIICKLNTAEN